MSDNNSMELKLQKTILSEHTEGLLSRYDFVKYLTTVWAQETPSKVVKSPQVKKSLLKYLSTGIFMQIQDLPVYKLVGHPAPSAQQVVCKLNPFCYLSHLSAMEWHHLTDRIPHSLHIISCSSTEFRKLSRAQAELDFPDHPKLPYVPYKYHDIKEAILDKRIEEHRRKQFKNPAPLEDSGGVRVASIGQTFLDMLREPQYCGGISHVLEVFEEQAEQYLAVILKTLEREGNSIDKVRVGYVLEERLGLSHPTIESWKEFAQRGSSRVLVAGEPFRNIYSEAWCLSLNLPDGN